MRYIYACSMIYANRKIFRVVTNDRKSTGKFGLTDAFVVRKKNP